MVEEKTQVTVKVGDTEVSVTLPSLASLQAGFAADKVRGEPQARKKGRARGEDTVLTNQMVFSVWDCTETIVHFVAGIGATEQLTDMLLDGGHELLEFNDRKNNSRPYKMVAGPQITYHYYWQPTEDFTKAVIHDGVRHAKSYLTKDTVRIKIFKAADDKVEDNDKESTKGGNKHGFWESQAWRETKTIGLLKKAGYKEPIHLSTEIVVDFLRSVNIVPKHFDTDGLAKAMLKAIADVLARYSIYEYPDRLNLYGDGDQMMAFLERDKDLAVLPLPIPQGAAYWEVVDILCRNVAIANKKEMEVENG